MSDDKTPKLPLTLPADHNLPAEFRWRYDQQFDKSFRLARIPKSELSQYIEEVAKHGVSVQDPEFDAARAAKADNLAAFNAELQRLEREGEARRRAKLAEKQERQLRDLEQSIERQRRGHPR